MDYNMDTLNEELPDGVYNNVMRPESASMDGERVEMMVDIYESRDGVRDQDFRTETNTEQPLQNTGSDCEKTRISRAAPVCLALLCFLLLTAVIALSVLVYTNNTNYTHESKQLQSTITNLTEESENLTKLNELMTQGGRIQQEDNELQQLDGWICSQSSCYFISSEKKSWNESRRDCREREADLTIINDREEQDFVRKLSKRAYVWIGLTDRDEEGRWKWVDGSELTFRFWGRFEPNGYKKENCALSYAWVRMGWADYSCDHNFQWVCEKRVLNTTHLFMFI